MGERREEGAKAEGRVSRKMRKSVGRKKGRWTTDEIWDNDVCGTITPGTTGLQAGVAVYLVLRLPDSQFSTIVSYLVAISLV
jgi:hypothetical protein